METNNVMYNIVTESWQQIAHQVHFFFNYFVFANQNNKNMLLTQINRLIVLRPYLSHTYRRIVPEIWYEEHSG